MSNYRRLISYIYAYEGGVKGKNIGYAKIEVRGDQCRIQVNVKKVYVGSNDIGVYLLSPGAEIMLGKIFIRGGSGEFRVSVHSGNVEGSGYSMDQCYGLTVHDVESTWQCYTTIWDDAVTQAAELGDGDGEAAGSGRNTGTAGNTGSSGDTGAAENTGAFGNTGAAVRVGDAGGVGDDVTEKAAEIELADVTSENVRAREVLSKIPVESTDGADPSARFPVSAEIERELLEEEARLANVAPWEQEEKEVKKQEIKEDPLDAWLPEQAEGNSAERMVEASAGMRDYIGELADSVVEETMEELQETLSADGTFSEGAVEAAADEVVQKKVTQEEAMKEEVMKEEVMKEEVIQEAIQGAETTTKLSGDSKYGQADGLDDVVSGTTMGAVAEPLSEPLPDQSIEASSGQKQNSPISSAKMMQEAVQQALQALMGGIMTGPEKPAVREDAEPVQVKPVSLPPELGDPTQLEVLDRMEKEAASQNQLWNQLGRRYPRVLAFDYDNGCEILSIKPQDIGLLPREVWVYGNNSFLLHGYYNYRHLILAKLNNPNGRPRYLLGVPGHYFSNEKYMASMFGFPNFVLAKKQPEADGRYGYWYTDIRL